MKFLSLVLLLTSLSFSAHAVSLKNLLQKNITVAERMTLENAIDVSLEEHGYAIAVNVDDSKIGKYQFSTNFKSKLLTAIVKTNDAIVLDWGGDIYGVQIRFNDGQENHSGIIVVEYDSDNNLVQAYLADLDYF